MKPTVEKALLVTLVLALWPTSAQAPGGDPFKSSPGDDQPLEKLSPARAKALRTTPTVRAVQRVGPAVVAIVSTRAPKENPYTDSPWGSYYQPRKDERSYSLGSGVIVDRRGYVLTNEHVVSQATEISVRLATGEHLSAAIVGTSPSMDLAVLRIITTRDLPAATLGNSEELLHGEPAIAIGTPFGLTQTVSQGVVSSTRRSFQQRRRSHVDFIQTDASIHPGNSGGPLVNILGEVIGINTAGLSAGPGIGLAIPASVACNVMADLMKHGRLRFPYLGAEVEDHPHGGVRVTTVKQDSPAAAAGLQKGDVIRELHDHPVTCAAEYWRVVRALVPGTRVTMRLSRRTVTLSVSGSVEAPPALANPTFEVRLGLSLGEASEHADRLKLAHRRGAVILNCAKGSAAWQRNLRAGDVIVGLATLKIQGVADVNRVAKTLKPGASVHFIVARGKQLFSFTMKY